MQLLITCPNCHTSYQIDEQQVKQSDGQASCYNCQTIFNAMQHAKPLPDDTSIEHLNLPNRDQPENMAEHDLNSLFIPGEHSEIVTGPDDIALQEPGRPSAETILDIDINDLPSLKPLEIKHKRNVRHYSSGATWGWSLAILLLLAVSLAQAGWYFREQLLANPQARQLMESACQLEYITCSLPAKRSPEAFEILERTVSIHPDVSGILSMSMLFVNQAEFSQPAPGFRLSLFDAQQQLIARRSFSYKDYLQGNFDTPPLFASGHVQKVFLNLEDPGADVTGFEFNFF